MPMLTKVKQLLHDSTSAEDASNSFLIKSNGDNDVIISGNGEGNHVNLLAQNEDIDNGVSKELFGALDSILPSLDELDADDLSTEVQQMHDYLASLKYLQDYFSSQDFSDLIDKSPIAKKDVQIVLNELASGHDIIESIQDLLSEFLDEDESNISSNHISTSRKLKIDADAMISNVTEGPNNSSGRRILFASEQSFGNYFSRSMNSHRMGHGYSAYFDRIINENQGHQGSHTTLLQDKHEDKRDHRKLVSIANDGSGDQCISIDTDTHKRNQCSRLAQCGQNYNLYDLFIFMFGDDIDFDTGTIDDKIIAFDERSFREKV